MTEGEKLKPCPACGKEAGELIEDEGSRFPFRVRCAACGWITEPVKLRAVAVDQWNDAKRKGSRKK